MASRQRLGALLLSFALVLPLPAAAVEEHDDEFDEVTAEELQLEDIPVDERIFLKRWNAVPFGTEHFRYSDQQMQQRWDQLTRALQIPYPSADYIRTHFERYPMLREGIENFDGDYEALHKRYLGIGRSFLAGEFQRTREEGMKLGLPGIGFAMLSQIIYAIYLSDSQSEKHMLLQDVMSNTRQYLKDIEELEQDADVAPYAILIRHCYTYAMARIAEEVPIPVAVARNYIPRIKSNADHIMELMPDQPMAHALRAGVDAGIIRRVGKFTGRITYRARNTVIDSSFQRAEEQLPDMALVLYEKANALVYVNRHREAQQALELFDRAASIPPLFAMEALDAMYAYKRRNEVLLYLNEFRSFRQFDKARRKFARATDTNLTSVLAPPLTRDMLMDPKAWLASR